MEVNLIGYQIDRGTGGEQFQSKQQESIYPIITASISGFRFE
jgi:hypothetical protein